MQKNTIFFLVLGVPTYGEGGGSTWLGQKTKFFQWFYLRAPLKMNGDVDEILPLFTFSPTLLDSHRCNGIFNQVKFLTIYLWCLWWWSASGKFLWSRSTWSMETQPLSPDLTPTPGLTLTFVTILYLCIGLYYLIYIVPVSMCSCVHVDHRRR